VGVATGAVPRVWFAASVDEGVFSGVVSDVASDIVSDVVSDIVSDVVSGVGGGVPHGHSHTPRTTMAGASGVSADRPYAPVGSAVRSLQRGS